MAEHIRLQKQLTDMRFDEWISMEFFHFKWWMLLILFILTVLFWWKKVDKSRLSEIILYTGLVSVMILVLDEIGEEMTLWDYPIDLIPVFPPITAIDIVCLPFFYSLIFQYVTKWKRYLIAMALMSAVSCFILEPIFVWTGIYQTLSWKSYYGLPLYFAIGVLTKAIISGVYFVSSRHAKKCGAAP